MERADKNIDDLLVILNSDFRRLRQSGINEEGHGTCPPHLWTLHATASDIRSAKYAPSGVSPTPNIPCRQAEKRLAEEPIYTGLVHGNIWQLLPIQPNYIQSESHLFFLNNDKSYVSGPRRNDSISN